MPYQNTKTRTVDRSLFTGLLCFLLLAFMLFFPKKTLAGAENGLLLWYSSLLPLLFPFILTAGLLIRLDVVPYISRILYPVAKHILPVSRDGSYPLFIGFLSGLPVGAKVSAQMAAHQKITKQEAAFLTSMCNNASPAFILQYCAAYCLQAPKRGLLLLAVIYLSAILASCILYRLFFRGGTQEGAPLQEDRRNRKSMDLKKGTVFEALDDSVMDALEAVAKIGGYVIVFSILSELAGLLPLPDILLSCLSGFLEISTGVKRLSALNLHNDVKFVLTAGFTAFGGICAAAQTKSVAAKAGYSMKPYFASKLLQGLLAACLSFLALSL